MKTQNFSHPNTSTWPHVCDCFCPQMIYTQLGDNGLRFWDEEGIAGSAVWRMGNIVSLRWLDVTRKVEPLHSREGMNSQGRGVRAAAGKDRRR